MSKPPIPCHSPSPRLEYQFVRMRPESPEGEIIDPETGHGCRGVIEARAAEGWRFVQSVPAGGAGRGVDLVFERPLRYRPLVFGHVPKTAGTSITNVLCTYMDNVINLPVSSILQYGHMIPYNDHRPLRKLPPCVRLVAGHFGQEHYQLLLLRDPFVVLSIRDPFERFLSALEHEYRHIISSPADAAPAIRDRHDRIVGVVERLRRGRGDSDATRQALEDLRADYVPSAVYMMYGGRPVAGAWIDSTEVGRLCEELAATTTDPAATLALLDRHAHVNIFPVEAFHGITAAERECLRDGFLQVFSREVATTEEIRRRVPHLFDAAPWATFMECLWRRPAATGGR